MSNKVNKTDIVNNLTSTNTDKPLSANMGKSLNDNKLDKSNTYINSGIWSNAFTVSNKQVLNTTSSNVMYVGNTSISSLNFQDKNRNVALGTLYDIAASMSTLHNITDLGGFSYFSTCPRPIAFTNWSDATNFPALYGSGICINALDGSCKFILYFTQDNVYFRAKDASGWKAWKTL